MLVLALSDQATQPAEEARIMSRKDYQLIAAVIKARYAAAESYMERVAIRGVALDLIGEFGLASQTFNAAKFRESCGLDD